MKKIKLTEERLDWLLEDARQEAFAIGVLHGKKEALMRVKQDMWRVCQNLLNEAKADEMERRWDD